MQQIPIRTKINTIEELIYIYPNCLDKIGSMPGSANKNIQPYINAPRKTPIAMKDTIKQELNKMEKKDIIRKVIEQAG